MTLAELADRAANGPGVLVCDEPALPADTAVGTTLRVRGWAVLRSGTRSIELLVDGVPVAVAQHGAPRPDVGAALGSHDARLRDLADVGWGAMVDLGPHAGRTVQLRVVATAQDGTRLERAGTLRVGHGEWPVALPGGVHVGRRTYGYDETTFQRFEGCPGIHVGSYCSFAAEVRVLGGGDHRISRPTSWPGYGLLFDPAVGSVLDEAPATATRIGHDVWLGQRALVLGGALIGDGAVIGAGAVVRKAVPPYAIVGGNPGRVVRYRFDEDLRRRLLALRWWDWDDELLTRYRDLWLDEDAEAFVREAERAGLAVGPSALSQEVLALPARRVTPSV